ncbi:hypothetical protein NHF46_17510 [Arthrobacter alpinus]|nr:hypothetical protein [Arthrobacter alpinus]
MLLPPSISPAMLIRLIQMVETLLTRVMLLMRSGWWGMVLGWWVMWSMG